MKKQITLFRTVLLATVMLCGVLGAAIAQTNLITNPGFETDPSTVTGTDNTNTNQLRRIWNTTDASTATTYPAPSSAPTSIAVTNGLWLKNTSVLSSVYCQRLTTPVNSGNYSVLMRVVSTSSSVINWTNFATQQRLALDNTKKYTLTFYASISGSTATPTFAAYIADKNGVIVANVTSKTFTPSIRTFTQYTATFDLPSAITGNPALDFSTAYVGVGFNPTYDASSKTQSSYLYLDDLSLSESTTPVISSTTATTTDQNPIPISITFNNSVTGFTSSDLVVSNGTVSSFSGNGTSYTATVTPTSPGAVTVNIAAGAATDGLSNATLAATQFSRTYAYYYRSAASGNWSSVSTWQSSVDNNNWVAAASAPTSATASVTIQNTHTVSLDANATVSGLSLNTGSIFNVNAGKQLTVSTSMTNNGTINLLSDVNGTATILTPATISGTGAVTVKQYLSSSRNWYMSSPVSGASGLPTVDSGTLTFYSYPESDGRQATGVNGTYAAGAVWNPVSSGTMATGTGYIIAPSAATPTLSFSGTGLNTGDQTINLSYTATNPKHGFNLIGNPYASYVDLSAFTQTSDTVHLETTYWHRTRNATNSAYAFDTYNLKTPASSISLSGKPVAGIIAPMQSFWVRVKNGFSSGSFIFRNAKRRHIDVSNNVLHAPAARSFTEPLLRLQVSNGLNYDETVLYSSADASNGFDDYDSRKFSNGSASIPEIYTTVGSDQLAINGMNAIPFNTEIPLGFTTGTSGNFSIKASQLANFDSSVSIYLKDYNDLVNTPVQLTAYAAYSFSSDVATNNTSRFALIFKSPSVATGINPSENSGLWISVNGAKQLVINGNSVNSSVAVFNAIGQKIVSKNLSSENTTLFTPLQSGVYLVTVSSGAKTVSKKVIID